MSTADEIRLAYQLDIAGRLRPRISFTRASDLDDEIAEIIEAFTARGYVYTRGDILSLIAGQLAEAIQHVERQETNRYVHELCDIVSIAAQGIAIEGGDPIAETIRRIEDKVLPGTRSGRISEKYRLPDRGGSTA